MSEFFSLRVIIYKLFARYSRVVNISDMQKAQDLIDAENQASKDASASVAKGFKSLGRPVDKSHIERYKERVIDRRKKEFEEKMRAAREADQLSRKTADSLMSSIREMVHAEVTGDGEQYSRHETAVRNELNELYARLGKLEYFIRQHLGHR